MTRSTGDSPAARALRAAGYVKLPGLWVTKEQFELAIYIAQQNYEAVQKIKREHHEASTNHPRPDR